MNKEKPSLLLIDGEKGLMHNLQKCVQPKDYLKVLVAAIKLNKKRMVLRDRYPGIRSQVIEKADKGKYLAALRILDDVMRRPIFVTPTVGELVQEDRADIETVGRSRLGAALLLREQGNLEEALQQLQTLRFEFGRLKPLKADINAQIKVTKKSLVGVGS